jgi:hypothetical protein
MCSRLEGDEHSIKIEKCTIGHDEEEEVTSYS